MRDTPLILPYRAPEVPSVPSVLIYDLLFDPGSE